MLKYLYRTCQKCKDYLGVVVRDPPEPMREVPIDAYVISRSTLEISFSDVNGFAIYSSNSLGLFCHSS